MSLVQRGIARILRRKNPTPIQYWEDRARTYGPRSVINFAHQDIEEVTKMQEREIFPHLRSQFNGSEHLVLDFGCGVGRFSPQLAELTGGYVFGIDPVRALLRQAPRHTRVQYQCVKDGIFPLPDHSLDVIWSCLVLGGISDLTDTIAEMRRTLKPGGLLFLVENTADKPSGPRWTFRSTGEYTRLFKFANLSHLGDYFDVEERISILAGRTTAL